MSDFFDGTAMTQSMGQGVGAFVNEGIKNSDWGQENRKKLQQKADREADLARRQVDVSNAKSKPGRRGTILSDAERVGAGVALPSDNSTTPYPFVTG